MRPEPRPEQTVVYDANGNFSYDDGEPVIAGIGPTFCENCRPQYEFLDTPPSRVISGPIPGAGTPMRDYPLIRFSGQFTHAPLWLSRTPTGDVNPLIYDANDDNVFEVGEPVFFGTPTPGPLLSEGADAESSSEVAETDFPWSHATHDKTQMVVPDAGYRHLLSTGNQASNQVEVEWESNSPMVTSRGDNIRGSDLFWGGLPRFAWPSVGDRVWIEGRWIFDCAHGQGPPPAYSTEIHPPRALVTFRLNRSPTSTPAMPGITPGLPVTGLTNIPVTQADVFVSGNGGWDNDYCNVIDLNISDLLTNDGCDTHSGPIIPINDRNYVFDIYPPGTDFTQQEPGGSFKIVPPTRDGSHRDASLQWRIIDHLWRFAPNGPEPGICSRFGSEGCQSVPPLLCPIDATTPPPDQTETDCPATPPHPTRLRVILPFRGTDANVFAQTILLGWDDIPPDSADSQSCSASVPMFPSIAVASDVVGCRPMRTFNISLNELKVIRNNRAGPFNGDWRAFVDVGGQWRYLGGTPCGIDQSPCDNGLVYDLNSDGGNACNGDSLGENADDDCFQYTDHPWTVSVQDGTPIHVAVGIWESHQIDSDFCRSRTGCLPDTGFITDFSCLGSGALNLPTSCLDHRIGTVEFDINPPLYRPPPKIRTRGVVHPTLDELATYEVTFSVEERNAPPIPETMITAGQPSADRCTSAGCATYVSSSTPITLSWNAPLCTRGGTNNAQLFGVAAFQYRYYRQGTALPTLTSNPLPIHWTSTAFQCLGAGQRLSAPILIVGNDGRDGPYVLQASGQQADRNVDGNTLVVRTEPRRTRFFTLDNTAPHSSLMDNAVRSFVGSTELVGRGTRFILSASDGMGSGVASLSYRVFRASSPPPPYTVVNDERAQFSLNGPNGTYVIEYTAMDSLGNQESHLTREVTLAPSITVRRGESLWTIAAKRVAKVMNRPRTQLRNSDIYPYWRRLIEANHKKLRFPNNPNLIFPGQRFLLPPM